MGRPRSESTRHAILRATAELVGEVGYAGVTFQAIAARAGAGKQTIYRWWTTKAGVIADAVVSGYLRIPSGEIIETDSLEADLTSWLVTTVDIMNDPATAPTVRALAAAASDDGEQAAALWAHLTGPLYDALVVRLRRGQDAGQLPRTVDPRSVADALMGTVLFQLLARRPAPADPSGIVRVLLGGAAPDASVPG